MRNKIRRVGTPLAKTAIRLGQLSPVWEPTKTGPTGKRMPKGRNDAERRPAEKNRNSLQQTREGERTAMRAGEAEEKQKCKPCDADFAWERHSKRNEGRVVKVIPD